MCPYINVWGPRGLPPVMERKVISKYAKAAPYSNSLALIPATQCPQCGYVPSHVQEAAVRQKADKMDLQEQSPPESESEEDLPPSGQKVNAKNTVKNQYGQKRH